MWLTEITDISELATNLDDYSASGFISVMKAIFEPLWTGLLNINIPGTNWPIAGFFIALLTAGLIGKLMKHLFAGVFNSHFEDGLRGGRPVKNGRTGGEE